MIFDDSFEHEVWNDSDELRIVLFLNFWHPCFAREEVLAIERLRRVLSSEILVHGEWKLFQQEQRLGSLAAAATARCAGGPRGPDGEKRGG